MTTIKIDDRTSIKILTLRDDDPRTRILAERLVTYPDTGYTVPLPAAAEEIAWVRRTDPTARNRVGQLGAIVFDEPSQSQIDAAVQRVTERVRLTDHEAIADCAGYFYDRAPCNGDRVRRPASLVGGIWYTPSGAGGGSVRVPSDVQIHAYTEEERAERERRHALNEEQAAGFAAERASVPS